MVFEKSSLNELNGNDGDGCDDFVQESKHWLEHTLDVVDDGGGVGSVMSPLVLPCLLSN